MKRYAAISVVAAFFLAAPVLAGSLPAVQEGNPQPNPTQLTKLNTKKDCGSQTGVVQRMHPNGSLVSEGVYAGGQRNGLYKEWYPDGKLKLTCNFSQGKLDGNCLAWFEIGKKRLSISFSKGRKDGQWLRFGEKVDDVSELNFNMDVLEGPAWVLINRGSGSGTGTSYQYDAQFAKGRLIGPFGFSYTDIDGRAVMVAGKVQPGQAATVEKTENVEISPQGGLLVKWAGKPASYPSVEVFFLSEMQRRVMPLYTLDFCGLEYDPRVQSNLQVINIK